ncbi:hypothetical protein FA13DRAFT_277279 [Coprinellus micaceus]|uniref:MYND-type domain-containing protein n=1 Tax=Coprinellus micaceus TaxID=71717 RepID=A0A4Y7SER4_COPMI|nr:hypothetical protein FA13DRAFT_277279 [Coprinellus micaceus]
MSAFSVLKLMEEAMSHGALRLLSISQALPPQERVHDDSFWTILDFASMVGCHLEVFPTVYKGVMKYIAPSFPDLVTAARGNPGYPLDPRLPSIFNINMIKDMAGFVDKEKRVRICDNLKHHDRFGTSNSMTLTSQEEHACSRCHSVAYCSVQCQHEDWAALHKAECKHMAKDYAGGVERKRKRLLIS